MKVMTIFGTRPEMIKMWGTLKKLDEPASDINFLDKAPPVILSATEIVSFLEFNTSKIVLII